MRSESSDDRARSCSSACPLLTARLATLQQRLAGATVDFVSFSVDPAHDTPAALAEYATRWPADRRWHLLATTPPALAEIASAMKVAMETGGGPDRIIHSDRFQLVDGDGWVRGVYDSTDDAAMQRLAADAAALAGAAPAATLPREGAALFGALGCGGCHGDRRVAMPLAGLFGGRVTLDDGRTVVADDAYVRESIVEPAAKLVRGYAPSMPSYAQLDGARLDALVGYVKSLRAAAPLR
ncbi:MAG: SCO family protein [Myxococcales bacterium]|nr:SCO family protein [Myxococcales bacterium]